MTQLSTALRQLGLEADSTQTRALLEQFGGRIDDRGGGSISVAEFSQLVRELEVYRLSQKSTLPPPPTDAEIAEHLLYPDVRSTLEHYKPALNSLFDYYASHNLVSTVASLADPLNEADAAAYRKAGKTFTFVGPLLDVAGSERSAGH